MALDENRDLDGWLSTKIEILTVGFGLRIGARVGVRESLLSSLALFLSTSSVGLGFGGRNFLVGLWTKTGVLMVGVGSLAG